MINLNSVSKASSILLESLSEQNQEKYSDFVHDLSSQIKRISRAYKASGLSLEDVLAALEEIAVHYEYLEDIDDLLESFKDKKVNNTLIIESICDLLEASMSDEDKRDSEIIRNLYKRVNGKKVSKFTPEEREVIDKYGLDVWGFRGDTTMITPGKNDVVKNGDFGKTSWNGTRFIPNKNADKINFADRARKVDSRDWGRKYSGVKDAYKQEYERADQAREMQRPYDELKSAKSRYNYSKAKLDDYYSDLAKQIEKADTEYTKAADTADRARRLDKSDSSFMINDSQDTIDRILNKHRKAVKEALKQLSLKEAMSDEDKKDSQLLRNILYKIEKRANAKLTPEEQAVLDKYNIEREYSGLRSHNNPDTAMTLRSGSDTRRIDNPKYNLAGKFRTGDRSYAAKVKSYSYGNDTFQAAERDLEKTDMGHDVTMMKNALDARRRGQAGKERAELEYNDAMDSAKANRERKIAQLMDLERYKGYKDQAEKDKAALNNVRRKYGLKTEESLKEGWGDNFDRKIDFYGDKVKSILDGIQGQMSDGIWENTPSMEAYWQNFEARGNAIFVPTLGYDWASRLRNPYAEMDDAEIRKYFANKAKYIAQLWMHDNKINPYKNWNADNTEECDYANDGITVADLYNFYTNNK